MNGHPVFIYGDDVNLLLRSIFIGHNHRPNKLTSLYFEKRTVFVVRFYHFTLFEIFDMSEGARYILGRLVLKVFTFEIIFGVVISPVIETRAQGQTKSCPRWLKADRSK